MTYNEWRDELKSNLLNVSESESRRVLDYYAEAYADRREAGYSEYRIIEDFGAPYDAAQRILLNIGESSDEIPDEYEVEYKHTDKKSKNRKEKYQYNEPKEVEAEIVREKSNKSEHARRDYTWVFVLLCVIFAIPLFSLIMSMIGITIGFVAAPFGLIIAGIGFVISGGIEMFSTLLNGLVTFGIGVMLIGVGIILMPLLIKGVKWMWKLFKRLFSWLHSLFSGREYAR